MNCDCADDFLCTAAACPRKGKAYSHHVDDHPCPATGKRCDRPERCKPRWCHRDEHYP